MVPCYFAGASICRSSLNFLSSRLLSSLMQVNILCRIPKLTISRNSMLLCSWRVVKRLFSVGHLSRSCFVPIGILSHRVLTNSPLVVQCRQKPSVPSRLLPSEAVRSTDSKFDWLKLWKFLSPDFFLLILAAISAVVVAAINIQIPLLLGELINTISHLTPGLQVKAYSGLLLGPGMKLAGYYCAQCLFTFVYITLLSVVGERFAVRLRTELFRSLMHQDIAFFDSRKTGELVSRLSADVQDFKSSFKMIVSQGLRSVTQTVGCVGSLLFISSEMTSVIAVTLPLMIGVGTLLGRALRRWSRQAQDQIAVATGVADEALGNVRTVRAFAMEEKEMELYAEELNKSSWFNEKLGSGIGLFQGLSNLAINGIVLVVVCHGGLLLANNRLSPGDLMSFLIATQTIQRSLASTSVLFGHLVRGMSAGSRVFEYMDYKPTIRLKGGLTLSPDDMQGNVELKGVTFAYPSRPDQVVLKDLSLCIPAGKVTALCGFSGAGKSTIAALLERFYDPQEGTVLIDERPLSDFDPTWFRESVIGIIHQEPVLFATTVMENIRYGKPTATDEEVYEVAKIANADEFVREFPNGYSTVVGERGHSVSGGQKQRIAISRALLKNPKILILDEATSALDSHSEKLVQEALDRASKGRTVVVIAHRLSTIRNADMIAVIHNGMLREIGTHDELLKGRGLYSQLIQRQTITHEMHGHGRRFTQLYSGTLCVLN